MAGYVLKPNDAGAKPAMKRNVSRLDGNPDLMALQPGLFRACQQTRAEGLAIFYQYRCFSFGTYLTGEFNIGVTLTKKNYNTLLNWLQRTGEFGRENIRGLVLAGKFDPADWSSIRLIHERLSDKATVVYEPMARHDASVLWAIGAMCESRYIGQAPTFRFFDQTYTTYNSDDEPSFNGGLGVSLSFSPGMSWFGGGQEASGQTTGSERHDVTAAENVKRFCAALSERSKDGFVRTLAR